MFLADDISISEDVLETAFVSGTTLTHTIPTQYQIKRKRVSYLTESTRQKLKKSLKEHRNK